MIFLHRLFKIIGDLILKIGIYLGDIKKPDSLGGLTFEFSIVDEILKQKTNHEFVFYYFGKKNIFKNQQNAKFVSLSYFKKAEFSLFPIYLKTYKKPLFSLNYILKKDNVNVVHFLVPYLFEHIEIPYFATIRDVSHRVLPHFPEHNSNSVVKKMEDKLKLFLRSASKIITCNELAKNDIKTLYNIIDENIITTPTPYPNWITNAKEDDAILKKHSLLKNSFILYPAQFWTHKNHIRLILATQIMQEQNINLKVVFTGIDRGNKNYLINQVKELDLEDEVLFLDYVSESELMALYKNAYALVYPSLAGTDSIAALEAMYFNCPVMISNHRGYIEQLKKAALYFNPLDEIDIVEKIKELNDLAKKDELLSKGHLLTKETTCKEYIDKFLNLLDNFYLIRQCWSLEENYKSK